MNCGPPWSIKGCMSHRFHNFIVSSNVPIKHMKTLYNRFVFIEGSKLKWLAFSCPGGSKCDPNQLRCYSDED